MDTTRVTGFLIPEFSQDLPDGTTQYGLTREGFQMVKEGYACGACLATFDRFTLMCPMCKTMREIGAKPLPAPQHWLDHLEERYADLPYEKPAVVNPFMDGQLPELPNMETIPLKDLKPSKKKPRRS